MEKKFVMGRGNLDKPEFLIFGEAPGKTENKEGEPFVGRAGKILSKWLKEARVDDYYISNVVFIIPLNRFGKIRPPTSRELEQHKPIVETIIEIIKPKRIITLGDKAAQSLVETRASKLRNRIVRYKTIPLSGIYHPAYYMRKGTQYEKGQEDFIRAVKHLRTTDYPSDAIFCPFCFNIMSKGTLYDGWAYCPKCNGRVDIHE